MSSLEAYLQGQEESEQAMETQDVGKTENEETLSERSDEAKADFSFDDPNSRMTWEDSFKRLVEFREKHGHCRVPNRYKDDPRLGSWVSTQRRMYKLMLSGGEGHTMQMTPERVKLLEEIGFEWSAKDPRHVPWEKRYQELVEFKSKYGHSQVPIGWKKNPQLSNWVSTQRQEYKLLLKGRVSRLSDERIEKLQKIDFIWEAQRGGPRRQKRATVCVPPKATPSAKSADLKLPAQRARGGRGGMRSVGSPIANTRRRESMTEGLPERRNSQGVSMQAMASSSQALSQLSRAQLAALLAHRQQAPASITSQTTVIPRSQASALGSGMGLLSAQQLRNIQMAEGVGSSVPRGMQQGQQAWNVLPTGAFQHAAAPMGMGIFPIATPLNLSAAGYQLGVIPTSMLQASSGATLQGAQGLQAAASAQQSSPKKRKKKRRKSKKKKKRRHKEEDQGDGDGNDSSSSSDTSSSEEDNV